MKKITPKPTLLFSFLLSSLMLTAQIAPDEDTGPYDTCNPEGANEVKMTDIPNPVNVGDVDDRSCYANYKESTVNGIVWGNYNITAGSNNQDTNTLQPRIERSLNRSKSVGAGSYARFTGTIRILEVGATTSDKDDGTYLIQAKGKHTGGGGSPDPAICLYLAKPVYETDAQGKSVQVSFNVFREQIKFRGGAGVSGRDLVFLTNIPKNVPTNFELEVGFREDPSDPTQRLHYADAVIGGSVFNWNIPEPERGVESGIRYGAYRVKGGRAQIRWANTTYEKEEVAFNPNLNAEYYTVQNVATGEYLTDAGTNSGLVTMSASGEADSKYWSFVESGSFFNIDSKAFGVLRGPGANFSGGAYAVVSTSKAAPSADGDKVWTIYPTGSHTVFRFASGTSDRFLYQETDGSVTHIPALETDDRSKWQVVALNSNQTLNISNETLGSSSIDIYPNPASANFTITLGTLKDVTVEIYNVLGKKVYEKQTDQSTLNVATNHTFTSGIYLIKATGKENKVYHSKLVIK